MNRAAPRRRAKRLHRLAGASMVVALTTVGSPLWAQSPTPAPKPSPSSDKSSLNSPPIESHPGFFDFTQLDTFTRDDLEIHISVKGPLLKLVAAASRDSEPELADTLGRLLGIEVRVYNLPEDRRDQARKIIDRTADELTEAGWKTAITVQVQRDHGYAFLKYGKGEENPIGLAAMYITDENQSVMVNIVGDMDMATIGSLARRFDLDLLAVSEE